MMNTKEKLLELISDLDDEDTIKELYAFVDTYKNQDD